MSRCVLELQMQDGKQVYLIMLHNEKYPSRTSDDSAGSSEPRLVVTGKFKECNYWFQEFQSREQRRIARVDRNLEDGGGHGKDAYIVQVAASVDVALILLVTMIIDACEHDDTDANENYTGRESTLDSSRTGDDRCRDTHKHTLSHTHSLPHSLTLTLTGGDTRWTQCQSRWLGPSPMSASTRASHWRARKYHPYGPRARGKPRAALASSILAPAHRFPLLPLWPSFALQRLDPPSLSFGGNLSNFPLHGALSLVTLSPYSHIALCHSRA